MRGQVAESAAALDGLQQAVRAERAAAVESQEAAARAKAALLQEREERLAAQSAAAERERQQVRCRVGRARGVGGLGDCLGGGEGE